MKITALVENNSLCGAKCAHGLSLYIETEKSKILFDLGPDNTIFENAASKGVDLSQVDMVIISHGHRDHGGALEQFLKINSTAKIYIQRRAFLPHFSNRPTGMAYNGLNREIMEHPQIKLLDGNFAIDDELQLFTVKDNREFRSSANNSLFEGDEPDNFLHEQNLIIKSSSNTLIMGCAHNGVINILREAEKFNVKNCIGGFHLTNPSAKRDEPQEFLDKIIVELRNYSNITFHTCHCTGLTVFNYLKSKMENINYLYCGDTLDL